MAIKRNNMLGNMLGAKISTVGAPNTSPLPEQKPLVTEQPPVSKVAEQQSTQRTNQMGKPRFELMPGESETKMNVWLPEVLYDAICIEARKEKKTVKQFVSETLMREMINNHGFQP